MEAVCCPRCRLLQPDGRACEHCGAPGLVALAQLTRAKVEGITTIAKPPPTGVRDALALLTTAFGSIAAAAGGVLLTRSALGLLLAPTFAVFGYRKQFWKTALVRKPRLTAVDPPVRPAGDALVGVARPFESTLPGSTSKTLAIATSIRIGTAVLARAIEVVPFWLTIEGRRLLVTGACWASASAPVIDRNVAAALSSLGATKLPVTRSTRREITIARVLIQAGDRIAVTGSVREEQLPGAGGYRDAYAETLRGEAGAVVWIERLDPETVLVV